MTVRARAYWLASPGHGEIRPVELPAAGDGDVVVRTGYSGISRGTETLVFTGAVPPSQHAVMRAPFQDGDFPGPVKYGYLNVGVVETGPPALLGRTVFCPIRTRPGTWYRRPPSLPCRTGSPPPGPSSPARWRPP